MRIVHVAPNAPYNDNWGYQENLLPKYQRKLGNDVIVIITNKEHKEGKIREIPENDYFLDDGEHIIRRKWKKYGINAVTGLMAYIPILDLLKDINPDFIFFHGLCSISVFDAIKYKKKYNKSCVIVQDNHLDYNIARGTKDIKGKLIRSFYRMITKRSYSDIDRFYGVTPWRQRFIHEYFQVPYEKTDVLIMGADDDKIDLSHKHAIRDRIRKKYNVSDSDFLIVTGGKIDEAKKIHTLIEAVAQLEDVHLIVFGEITPSIKEYIEKIINSNNTDIIGWIRAEETYDYFLAADLVCFPGQHSVLWEQACACKVPCLFAKWDGMDHVNNGGNSAFISDITPEGLRSIIEELKFTEKYYQMKEIAESNKTDIYLYSSIAKKSLEMRNMHTKKNGIR